MRYSFDDIWNQATNDSYSANLDGFGYKSRIVYGIKIIRDDETGDVIIYNTSKGGDYYQKLNEDELKIFHEKGWRHGVYVLSLSNYRSKLDSLQKQIRNEVNGKNSKRTIEDFKTYRDSILAKYNEVKEKLNKLN